MTMELLETMFLYSDDCMRVHEIAFVFDAREYQSYRVQCAMLCNNAGIVATSYLAAVCRYAHMYLFFVRSLYVCLSVTRDWTVDQLVPLEVGIK